MTKTATKSVNELIETIEGMIWTVLLDPQHSVSRAVGFELGSNEAKARLAAIAQCTTPEQFAAVMETHPRTVHPECPRFSLRIGTNGKPMDDAEKAATAGIRMLATQLAEVATA